LVSSVRGETTGEGGEPLGGGESSPRASKAGKDAPAGANKKTPILAFQEKLSKELGLFFHRHRGMSPNAKNSNLLGRNLNLLGLNYVAGKREESTISMPEGKDRLAARGGRISGEEASRLPLTSSTTTMKTRGLLHHRQLGKL